MYNPGQVAALTYQQISELGSDSPLFKRMMQLGKEARSLQRQIRTQGSTEELQQQLAQVKSERAELTIQWKNKVETATLGVKVLMSSAPTTQYVGQNFTPFEQIAQISIVNWYIEPELQRWVSPPNKLVTIYDNNGIAYFVKAQYDENSKQIFAPI